MISNIDGALQVRIHELHTQSEALKAAITIAESAIRIGDATRAEDYPAVRSELLRLKSRCDSLMIIAATYEALFDSHAIKLLFSNEGGYSE